MEDNKRISELISDVFTFNCFLRFKKCSYDDNVIQVIKELEQQLSLAEQKLKVIQIDNEKEERK